MIKNSPYKSGCIERGQFTYRGSQSTIVPTEPLNVPLGERQLVMHRAVMEDHYDCRRTVHPVEKHPDNPLISAARSWEGDGPGTGCVLYDRELGKFRMWSSVKRGEFEKLDPRKAGPIYYESDDGVEWQRPNLGQVDFEGSRENNLLEIDYGRLGPHSTGAISVFELPNSHRQHGRFGAVLASANLGPACDFEDKNAHRNEQLLAFSEDGYRWTVRPDRNPFFRSRSDGFQTIVWNPDRQVFLYYRRATVNAREIRRISCCESPDLIDWTQPRLILGPDEPDPNYFYGMPVSRYQNMYLGLLQNLYLHTDFKVPKEYEIDIQLTWSHDGLSWERHPDRPVFIPTGRILQGVPDWGMVFGMKDVVDAGDRAYVYYGGRESLHSDIVQSRALHICLGTLRRDGFVSLDSPREGWALTAPIRCPGGKLHINGKTASDGIIQVALREGEGIRDGEWPGEWSLDYATDFVGNSVDHEVNWKGQTDLSAWKDKTIRLEFRLFRAKLYSFWFGPN